MPKTRISRAICRPCYIVMLEIKRCPLCKQVCVLFTERQAFRACSCGDYSKFLLGMRVAKYKPVQREGSLETWMTWLWCLVGVPLPTHSPYDDTEYKG